MKELSRSVEIDAPANQVWSVMRDVERWPEWTSSVTEVRAIGNGPFAIGSRVFIRQPRLRGAVWQVTELVEGKGFTWVSRSPGTVVTGGHWIESYPAHSRVTLSVRFSGLLSGVVARLAGKLTERYLAIEANGLKLRSETLAGRRASGSK